MMTKHIKSATITTTVTSFSTYLKKEPEMKEEEIKSGQEFLVIIITQHRRKK
jgi:hypothetical protein